MICPMSPYTRDDPRYWFAPPADHSPNGLYAEGPEEARLAIWDWIIGMGEHERETMLLRDRSMHMRRMAIRRRMTLASRR